MTYAIFSEYAREQDLFQGLFIPATPLGATVLRPTFAHRTLEKGRRRRWSMAVGPVFALNLEPTDNVRAIVSHEIEQFESISSYMRSPIVDPAWTLRAAFPVEVTASDFLELKDNNQKMPDDLNARISALREVKGLA